MTDTETKKKRKFRFPIVLKTVLIFFVAGGILAEIAMIYFSLVNSNTNKERYKSIATDLSYTIALSIDVDKVKNVVSDVISIYDEYDTKYVRDEYDGTPEFEEYLARFDAVRETQDYKDLQSYLLSIREANSDADAVYLGYVDYGRKLCIYIVYDEENEFYPTGVIDGLYEEDYPLVDNPKLGFLASIYDDPVEGIHLVTAGAPIIDDSDQVVCYALVDITMARVRAKQADGIVREKEGQLDSVVEQGGANFSGGQKQRICLARAILKNPKILILDDSTSAVDTKTDHLIRKGLKNDLPAMTKIVIAQRISSIEDADQIVIMDDGKIDAIGTHDELLKNNVIYQEVYNTQNAIGGGK